MTALDWLILAVFGVSSLVGLLRGAAFELVSLGGWVAAFMVAHHWSGDVAARWLQGVQAPALRDGLAWGILFSLTLLLAGLLATLLRLLLRSTGLGMLDRSLGAVFGVVRGALVIVLLAWAAGYTQLPSSQVWQGSLLAPLASAGAARVAPWLPLDHAGGRPGWARSPWGNERPGLEALLPAPGASLPAARAR